MTFLIKTKYINSAQDNHKNTLNDLRTEISKYKGIDSIRINGCNLIVETTLCLSDLKRTLKPIFSREFDEIRAISFEEFGYGDV